MSKFTKGEWRVFAGTIIRDERNRMIASVPEASELGGDATDVDAFDETRANARLIARAPAMYAALQKIIDINGSTGGAAAMVNEFKFLAREVLADIWVQP